MKSLNILGIASLGLLALTACEDGGLYEVNSPDWLAQRVDSIKNNKPQVEEVELEGMMEDVYTIGKTDYSSGWWAEFTKDYVIPQGEVWNAVFQLNINPAATNTYKNFALIITSDAHRGEGGYVEYGAIRYDHQPSGNSEWGDYIDRDCVESTLTFGSDTDAGVDKLGGKVTLTIDRTDGGLKVTMNNGTVVKNYVHPHALENLNQDASNENIRAFLVPEGSYIDFKETNIEPVGGCTSAEDKLPLEMVVKGVPAKVLVGTPLEEAMANMTITVNFEQEVSKGVTVNDVTLDAVPDMETLGMKTLVICYNKTYKGEYCSPVLAYAQFEVVDQLESYTTLGALDNSTGWWGAHSSNVKVAPGETRVTHFTNYSGGSNWNNYVMVLCRADNSEYAVVRSDNYGWGAGYEGNEGLVTRCYREDEAEWDWATWLAAMDGAQVTTYVTNNGDGTVDVKAVINGNDGMTYYQEYLGINTVDPDDFYFRYTVDGCHLVFDVALGESDNSTGWWGAHSPNVKVEPGKTVTEYFTNYTPGLNNWNNFVVVLCREDNSEYAVVRSDNYGWGDGYAACLPSCNGQEDWAGWLAAMNEAKVTVSVTNNGNGTADIHCDIVGNNGVTYFQDYTGIDTVDPDNFYFRFTVDGCHLVFDTPVE